MFAADKSLSINCPINPVSFGFVSIAILRELHKRNANLKLFPIGEVNPSCQKPDNSFFSWINQSIHNSLTAHSRKNPIFKLWHINGLMESFSEQQAAITFLETDSVTDVEVNILNNQHKVFVTSNYCKQIMSDFGVRNVQYLPLGFDHANFYEVEKKRESDVITWLMPGKLERRKNHAGILQAWVKKFGNDKNHVLICPIANPFLKSEELNGALNQILEGKKYFNVKFRQFMPSNAEYNDMINSCDIVLAMSGGEGRDLPVYHAVGLGKHCVGLRAHAYLDYLDNTNSVLLSPSGKFPAPDGKFFHPNAPFNQGNFYTFKQDEFIGGCEEAIKRFQNDPVNHAGKQLQKITYANTVNSLLL